LVGGVAYAAPPEDPADEPTEPTVTVTVDDIIAVTNQLEDYDTEIRMMAQLIYAEARGVKDEREQAAVCWVVLNRADSRHQSIRTVITARHQFAYRRSLPVKAKFKAIARDVLTRWLLEKRGIVGVGRVLPRSYTYFAGHNGHNRFRNRYRGGTYWRFNNEDPDEGEGK
jgi:hypothetical protein